MPNLLDTHTLIWFLSGDNALSEKAKNLIQEDKAINFVSIASFWEMAIKISLNKLELKKPFEELSQQIEQNNFNILPVSFTDTLIVSSLPFHHRDPFDRILVAQAITNKLRVISKDSHFALYKIEVVW
jgi:PIN domain nuclease of toxin-antitoxin system